MEKIGEIVRDVDDLEQFQQLVSYEDTLVYFWAKWCNPCRAAGPAFQDLADATDDMRFVKLDIEAPGTHEVSQRYGVLKLPTFLVFKNGKVTGESVGFENSSKLSKFVEYARKDIEE